MAQYTPTGPVAGRRHGGNGGNGNGTTTIQIPPPLLGPMSLGLIERDFQYLRATSPRPNEFMGGRWNPQTVQVPRTQFQSGYGYGYGYPGYGYGYGYSGYGYGGGIYVNGGFANGYLSGGFGGGPTIIQRETVIIREGQSGRVDGQNASRPDSREDDFYLGGSRPRRSVADERLTDALDDIRKAWLNGDSARLEARFDGKTPVGIFIRGKYKYDVAGKEFSGMLKDAMKRIDTMSFEFDRPKTSEPGKAFVTGKHTFLSAEKEKQETYISYGLERIDGRWLITEAGSSSEPVTSHSRDTKDELK
jgi:hypothetical protein